MTAKIQIPSDQALSKIIRQAVREAMTVQEDSKPAEREKISYSIPDLCITLDLSRQSIYDEINAGRLRSFTVGRRRFVSAQAIQDWIKHREAETNPVAEEQN